MKATFLYADSGISPHPVHKAWAMSVCQNMVRTPKGAGRFNIASIPESDILIIESLYCLPFVKAYKKTQECKVIAIIDDTSFWKRKLSLLRKLYYNRYLGCIDGFVFASERIADDAKSVTHKPYVVHRPFILVNRHRAIKKAFSKNILFIGNDAPEKGYKKLITVMRSLQEFSLYLVGRCGNDIRSTAKNVYVEGRVQSLEKYFGMCTYYVHPADFEPFGVAPAEAMYAGLLPLLTKDVGLTELFTKQLNRFILPDNKPVTIAHALVELDKLPGSEKRALSKLCSDFAHAGSDENQNTREFKQKVSDLVKRI